MKFIKGDKVRVLAIDKDAILIQRNDSDNEIDYVSLDFLKDITGETIKE